MVGLKYFSIYPCLPIRAPSSLFYQDEKNELCLSSNVRLCGMARMAHIDSRQLAEQFVEACLPTLQKRYGNETTLEIFECMASATDSLKERIKVDSEIIRKRIATNNFSPNKAP